MSTFGTQRPIQNQYTYEEYEDHEGKKRKRVVAPAESCPYCLDELMLCMRAEFKQGGSTYSKAIPCKWCVRGLALSTRLARGGRGQPRIPSDLSYTDDDVVLEPRSSADSDVEKARRWLEAGWERRADGALYSIHDGRPAPVQPPEDALPPLPDGTRPPGGGQRARIAPGLVRSVDEPDRRSDGPPGKRRRPTFSVRLVPAEDGATVYVTGALGPLFDAGLRFSDLGKASPSRAELEQASRVSGVPMGKLLAALRKMAGEKPPQERWVRPDPPRPDRSSEQARDR